MMALSLARRTAELVPMYAGHGATMLLNQVGVCDSSLSCDCMYVTDVGDTICD
jgi:hypothetical protein